MEAVADEGTSMTEESRIKSFKYKHFSIVNILLTKYINILSSRS